MTDVRATLDLSEIEPALADPNFDPTWVIMILDLSRLGISEVRSVSRETATQVIEDISTRLIVRGGAERWQRELARVVSEGLTPVIKLVADDQHAYLEIHGVEIVATAKA